MAQEKTFDFSILKTLRKKWKLSAEELAARANITRATVAKIESGRGNPTVETLAALSRVFQLSASELIRMAEASHCEAGTSEPYENGAMAGVRIVFSNFELYHLKAAAGTRTLSEAIRHENTAEVCVVLSGKLKINIQGQSHELGPNTSIRYKALYEHGIEVLEDASFLMIHHNLP